MDDVRFRCCTKVQEQMSCSKWLEKAYINMLHINNPYSCRFERKVNKFKSILNILCFYVFVVSFLSLCEVC